MIPRLNLTDISGSLSDIAQPDVFARQCKNAAAEEPLVESNLIWSLFEKKVSDRLNKACEYI